VRLDELFKDLGYLAATLGAQIREGTCEGVPLADLDLTGAPPRHVAVSGSARVELEEGPVFRVDAEHEATDRPVRFALDGERLTVTGGGRDTVVRITLPAPGKLSVAGSGNVRAARLSADGEVSIAGSGHAEIAAVDGGQLRASIAGSGRLAVDGRAEALKLSIAGSGSCDAEGLLVDRAEIHIAGSGDAIFACDGEVSAHLMGAGNVIVRGSARCNIHSMGSGTVTCERERESAD